MPFRTAYLSLGSNVGERRQNLERAMEALEREHVRVVKRSSIFETQPQDVKDQPWFLNMVVEGETRYFPLQLLTVLQRIECELGRVRRAGAARRGPRIIDIDVLLIGNKIMSTPALVIPHPRMLERRFVLEPLLEIAPDLKHPVTKEPLSRSLSKLAGQKVFLRETIQ
jgi:2-amino-4-hydroxy-6-hydroxymethyldihydropteridine diphosphokinase